MSNMGKTFRDWNPEQAMMFPATPMDFVGKDELVPFIRNLVLEQLDLREILNQYQEERGYPPFHPVMMTALLLYSYCQGIYSSRRIAKACKQRVDFLALTGMQKPDHRTVNLFRQRHLRSLGALFGQVVYWMALELYSTLPGRQKTVGTKPGGLPAKRIAGR